jgi:20S proteasome alpha/beta subunit
MHSIQSHLFVVTLLGATLLLGACASGPETSGSKTEFDHAYAAAQNSFDRSESLEHAWTTAEEALKEAKEAAAAGDYRKATELANEANEQSELAIEQAERESQPDMTLY